MYRPAQHKTGWRGKSRAIAVGPKAQAVLQPFLTADPEAYLFSPAVAVAELHAARTKARRTPRYSSHMRRNVEKRRPRPARAPAAVYNVTSYGHAIKRACDSAFPLPKVLAPLQGETRRAWWARLTAEEKAEVTAWRKHHHWHPNQLRHSFATRVRKEHGLEAAQVLLGYTRADVTQVYAERDERLATEVAAAVG